MLEALDNRYRGATTTDIILSLSEIHNKVFSEENDMSTFLDEMGSLFANLKAMKCGLPDIVQVGLLLAKIPKTSSLHAAAASLRSMDPKLLTWELVANRLVAEHKTLKVPKPGNNMKSKRRKGRQNKNARTKMILHLMKRLIAKTLRKLPRCRLGFERQRNVLSQLRFLWKGRPFSYQMFPESKQSKQSPPGQAARKTFSS